MLATFDAKFNFKEDIASIVEGTLEWAFNLPYSNAKRVRKEGLCQQPWNHPDVDDVA